MRSKVNSLAGMWVCPLLLWAGLATAASPDLRLVDAVARQDADTARALLDEGVDVNAARADGVMALLWAAHWDDLEMAGRLLRAGADVNAAEDHGVTPLARACENASLTMIATLLAAGADPNATQTSGLTPLMTAARTGSLQVVEALLARGADVNASTVRLEATALMWAVAAPHPAVVRVLLDAGADPNTSTTNGYTTLMYAARNSDIPMAETLIAAGVDINTPSANGTHILPFSIINGRDQFALFLIERGADPNGSLGGIRALHAAVGAVGPWMGGFGGLGISVNRRLPVVEALLARGADPNARITTSAMIMFYVGYPKKGAFETYACGTGDLRGATPLWVAAYVSQGAGLAYRDFSTFCPKALAGIGTLPDTVTDRSIRIALKRRAPGERVARFRQRDAHRVGVPLRAQLEAWSATAVDALRDAEPDLPGALGDRAADVWEPLIAIADLAGGDWPTRARHAATALSGKVSVDDDTLSIRLLHDIRRVFTDETLGSAALVGRLVGLEDRPWADWAGWASDHPNARGPVAEAVRYPSDETALWGADGQRLHDTDVRRPLGPVSAENSGTLEHGQERWGWTGHFQGGTRHSRFRFGNVGCTR